jgi:hypothetical protein
VSLVLAACGGGVDVEPVEGEWPPVPKTGTVQVELADPVRGTLTRMTINLTGVTGKLDGLYDDAGKPPVSDVKAADLARVCYMSSRAGWNEQARACTNIHAGPRPTDFACYDENNQRTSCPDAFLSESPLVPIFRDLRNNDQGALRVQVAATGQWYTLGVAEWPCTGAVACTENTRFLREYGGYRPTTGEIACIAGVPTARIRFGTDALVGFGPAVKPGETGPSRWNSDTVGWALLASPGPTGSISRDTNGDYLLEIVGLPVREADGTFSIFDARKGEWSWMDPTAFTWNANVTVNAATYHLGYDLGTCP